MPALQKTSKWFLFKSASFKMEKKEEKYSLTFHNTDSLSKVYRQVTK